MSAPGLNQEDELLRNALRRWQVAEPLPPRFQEQVWQRIAREEARKAARPGQQLFTWITAILTRPSFAVSYVTVLLLAGLLSGYWHARSDSNQASQELSARYVRMMDPYQAPPGVH